MIEICDLRKGKAVYMVIRQKKSPEETNMFKTIIAAVLIILAAGTAVCDMKEIKTHISDTISSMSHLSNTEYQQIFDLAMADVTGGDYTAAQMVEKQITDGTDYRFIAESTDVYPGAAPKTIEVTVHESPEDIVSISDITEL